MTTIAGYPATIRTLALHEFRALIPHDHAKLFPVLVDDDRDRLRASMKTGYDEAHPIVVWAATGQLADGRNRRDLALELELELRDVPVAFVEFPDEAAVTTFIVAANLARRHLTTKKRAELAGKLVRNGASTRAAAEAAGVSQSSASRAVRAARHPESKDSTARQRVVGLDGKSYSATRPTPPKVGAALRRAVAAIDRAHDLVQEYGLASVTLEPEVVEASERLRQRASELASAVERASTRPEESPGGSARPKGSACSRARGEEAVAA